jgi:hypothetical protein
MDNTMTTSGMTGPQIDRACEIFRAQLTKHASEFPSEAVQQVFGQPELGPEWLAVLRRRVEAFSQTYIEEVDYNDPQWRRIDGSRYAYVGDVTVDNYPNIETGKKLVRFRELAFDHDPTDEEILVKTEQEGCRQPSRAEAETVIRKRYTCEQLAQHPRIGLIGAAVECHGDLDRAYVYGDEDGVNLDWDWTGLRWNRDCRFLVACK